MQMTTTEETNTSPTLQERQKAIVEVIDEPTKRTTSKQPRSVDETDDRPKKKKTASILTLPTFTIDTIQFGQLTKHRMCNLVPINNVHTGKPIYVQLSGGGDIPLSFGLEENKETPNKFNLNFSITNEQDVQEFGRIKQELSEYACGAWSTWFPSTNPPSKTIILNSCNPLCTEGKDKSNGSGRWPGLMKATFDVSEIEQGSCKIREFETGTDIDFQSLAGMSWHRAIVELRYLYIQSSKSYGFAKRLRYLEVSEGYNSEDVLPID